MTEREPLDSDHCAACGSSYSAGEHSLGKCKFVPRNADAFYALREPLSAWSPEVRERWRAFLLGVENGGDSGMDADIMTWLRRVFVASGLAAGTPTTRPLASVEREHVLAALAALDGNISRAAAALGISRRSLYRRLHEYGAPIGQREGPTPLAAWARSA